MGAKRKHQAPHSADTKAVPGISGFAGIPKCVLKSEAYTRLSLMARAILFEIAGTLDGHNNGFIHVSYAELAKRLNRKNQAPIGPAIAELMKHGLIDLSSESVWRERKAREYRVTFVNTTDAIGRTIKATNDYLHWRAKNDATDVVAAKVKSATPFVVGKIAAATDAVAGTNGKLPKTLNGSATTGVVLISKPYAGRESEAGPPACLPSKNAGAQNPDEPGAAVAALRGKITRHWRSLKTSARRNAWASANGITADELKTYITGDPGVLPFPKQVALASSARAANG